MKRTQKTVGVLLLLGILTFIFCALFPSQAYAKSYSMSDVDIQAEATSSGDMNIVEQRTFDFDGDFSAVWWTIDDLPDDGSIVVNGATLTYLDDEGNPLGETQTLSEEPFVLSWRDAGGPGIDSYSVDDPQQTIYVFLSASDQKVRVSLDYTLVNMVRAWKDVGEVYWMYVGDQWAEPADNISLTLTLPVPAGESIDLGTNAYAWGHGPLDGTVEASGPNTVFFTVPHLNAEQFAEAHVLFPVEWLTDHVAESEEALSEAGTNRLDSVLQEEAIWADQANRERVFSIAFIVVFALIAIALLAWAIVMYQRYGKEHVPGFTEEYWRDVPSPTIHPAVIARLWRWNKESNDDFTATLMYLSSKGAIQINKGSYEKPGVFGAKTVDDYYLSKVPAVAATLVDPIDIKMIEFLFDTIGGGADAIWFTSIQEFGKANAQRFIDEMSEWQGLLTAETNKQEFFELKSQKLQMRMIFLATLYIIASSAAFYFLENFIPVIIAIPVAIALFAIAKYMPRRTQEGTDLDAKAKALRNWLKDFSALDERPPTDVKVWGEFMVYAYIFGIAQQVIAALQLKVPELFGESDGMGVAYTPWWFWYGASHGLSGQMLSPAADLFQTSFSNTVQTARAAISAAGGNSSSGGGFGGGFSGGGGGGFGGGGGGAR